jgi:transcriptional regulator with XRE-family HTH domain
MKRMIDVLEELSPGPLTSGQVIRALRNSLRFTLKDVEKITGLSEQRLSSLENDRSSLTVKNARKISAALGVNPFTILFPNGPDFKDKEIQKIERLREKLLKEKKAS